MSRSATFGTTMVAVGIVTLAARTGGQRRQTPTSPSGLKLRRSMVAA